MQRGEKYGEKILAILKAIVSEGKVQFMESLTLSAPYMVRVSIPDLNILRIFWVSHPAVHRNPQFFSFIFCHNHLRSFLFG